MPYSRSLPIALTVMLFGACNNEDPTLTDDVGQPVPVQNWIEVPLSDSTYNSNTVPWRSATYDVYVAAYNALEFKLDLREGDSIVYRWNVEMDDPDLLKVEFHGHTERVGEAPGTVMFYTIHSDGEESGTLTAPFDGIHGWYLNNTSAQDIVVVLTVAGFYTEVE